MRSRNSLLVLLLLAIAACSPSSPTLVQPHPTVPTRAALATLSPDVQATATPPPTPTETLTLAPTDTPQPVATATIDSQSATSQAELGSMGYLMSFPVDQLDHPVGSPLQSWHDVPIMLQASAGQELSPHVYDYLAAASLSQAQQFYASQAAALGISNLPMPSYGGTGNKAFHSVILISFAVTIYINSYDNDPEHVIVAISKVQ